MLERAHRVKTDKNKKISTPRTTVWRILNYKGLVKTFRNVKKLKGKNIFLNENFWQATLDHRKELWNNVKVFREEGTTAYFQYRSIVAKREDSNGQCLVKVFRYFLKN